MTATNHALTGTAIGLIIGVPIIALPVALLSHFVCDAIPHYGSTSRDDILKNRSFRNYLMLEASLCFLIVATLAILRPDHWQLASVCAFLAASPDLYWFKRYFSVINNRKWKPDWFGRFANDVQWFQGQKMYNARVGIMVELGWLTSTLLLIFPLLRSS